MEKMIKIILDIISKLFFKTTDAEPLIDPFEFETKAIMLSEYLSLKRAIKSNKAIKYGIKNEPDHEELICLTLIGYNIYDKLVEEFGNILNTTSIFRNKKVNRLVKGWWKSQHKKGEAIDIDQDIMTSATTNAEIFHFIKDHLVFDQLIWEHGSNKEPAWIHVSYRKNNNRNNVLRAYSKKNAIGKWVTKYRLWS